MKDLKIVRNYFGEHDVAMLEHFAHSFLDNLHKKLCEGKASDEDGALPIPDVRLSLPDIRNKLSPIKNLIAMLNNGLMKGTIEVHPLIEKEIEQCKKSITYLSGNEA